MEVHATLNRKDRGSSPRCASVVSFKYSDRKFFEKGGLAMSGFV